MNQRCFPPSKSLLGGSTRQEPDDNQKRSQLEDRRGFDAPQSDQTNRRKHEDLEGEDLRARKRPKVEKKVFNELDHPQARPPEISDSDIINEAFRFLDVDVFAVQPENLPLLLENMLTVEQRLNKVSVGKEDIRQKMVKIYEQESADTRFCLSEMERRAELLPHGVPGAAPEDHRRWLHNARMTFLRIDMPHKNIAKTVPNGPVPGFSVPSRERLDRAENAKSFEDMTASLAPPGRPMSRPGRPLSRDAPFAPAPQVASTQRVPMQQGPSLNFTLPPPSIPPLGAVAFTLPPPSFEPSTASASTSSSSVGLPDFSRPPPMIADLKAVQTAVPQHKTLPITIVEPVKITLKPLMEVKTSANFIPVINTTPRRQGLPNFNYGMY